MRQAAKTLTARAGFLGLVALFACSPLTSFYASNAAEEAISPVVVINDQYKFTQISYTPFVIDGFSGFDYTGYKVYQVFVHTVNSTDYVKRVFGNAQHPAAITAPGGIYNNNFCVGATSGGVPPAGFFYGGYNAHQADSWVGIGLTAFPNDFIGEEDVTLDTLAGNPWDESFVLESMSSGNYGPVDIFMDDAGADQGWRLSSENALNGFAGDDYKTVVMQLTTDSLFTWTLSAEIWIEGDSTNAVIVSQSYNGVSMEAAVIEGCTDSNACNFYDLANTDNGTCQFPATYYDCDDVCLNDADNDGVCDELEILGCTSILACNYNVAATDDDASCVFPEGCETCSGATDGSGQVVDNDADDDGVCDADEVVGCQDETACNYDEDATDAGSCLTVDGICESCSGETDGTGTVVDNDTDDDGVCDADEVVGCQDSNACNYMAAATDAGSCNYATGCDFCSGANDGTGTIVDGDTDDDGVCDVDEIAGCQDSTACNYDATATDSDGSCDYCSCGQLTGMSPYSLTVEEHAVDGIPGHTTFRIYVNMDHPNDYLSAVYGESPGDVSEPFVLTSTSTPNWYNDPIAAADFGWEITPILQLAFPETAFDSWFTTGPDFGPPGDFFTTYGSAGTGFWPAFNSGEDINITSEAGFSIYNVPNCGLPPGTEGSSCNPNHPAVGGDDGRVLVAQLTTTGIISGEFSVSILQNGNYGSGIYHTEHFAFNGVGTFSADGWSGAMASEYQDCGCTDATALNYDDEAVHDDGGCIPVINGCMDSDACNYMDTATVDDGGCILPTGCETCSGDTDGTGTVVDNDADDDGVCDADEVVGCQDSNACNYHDLATDSAECVYATGCETCSGGTDGTGTVVDNDADDDGVCDTAEIAGCQDSAACNYNAAATDAGDCTYPVGCDTCSGETDGSGTVVDNDADDDGVCDSAEIAGCQDDQACNYNAAATDSGATCEYATGCETCSGETDGTGYVVDNDQDNDGICDSAEVVGCQDEAACNFNSAATDAGTCEFAMEDCEACSGNGSDGTGTVVLNDADGDGVCDADEVPGCRNPDACNYNAAATDENGSCTYAVGCDVCAGGATDGTGYVEDLDADDDGVCDANEVAGCQNSDACNFNAAATDEDGTCVYATGCESCSGATDGTGTVVANDDDNDGICNGNEVPGCEDPLACNYNAAATDPGVLCVYATGCDTCSGETDGSGSIVDLDTDDDGICDADEVVGCQNAAACNYDSSATDPGTCYIAGPYYDCSGECLNDSDNDGICDEIEDMLFDEYTEGYTEGFLDGLDSCTGGPEYCGEGTVWSEDFQMCVEDSACPGDLNGDLIVGTEDLLILLMDYGFFCD